MKILRNEQLVLQSSSLQSTLKSYGSAPSVFGSVGTTETRRAGASTVE